MRFQKRINPQQRIKNNKQNNSISKSSDRLLIYGKNSCLQALKSTYRSFYKIYVVKNFYLELVQYLEKIHKNLKSIIEIVDSNHLDSICANDANHQGIALICSKKKELSQLDLLEFLYENPNNLPSLVILDQLTDTHNIGSIIRSSISFGIKDIILCKNCSPSENSTIFKTSVGSVDLANLYFVSNLNDLIAKLKKIGYWVIGLDSSSSKNIREINQYKNLALIVGSEGSGMRKLVKANCDILLNIPIKDVESLNASVAASIALYQYKNEI